MWRAHRGVWNNLRLSQKTKKYTSMRAGDIKYQLDLFTNLCARGIHKETQ